MRSSILRTKNNRFYGRDKWAQKKKMYLLRIILIIIINNKRTIQKKDNTKTIVKYNECRRVFIVVVGNI